MTPFKILKYILSIFLSLGFIMLVFPSEGIKIPGNNYIYFYSFDDIFPKPKEEYKNISYIFKQNNEEDPTTEEIRPLDVKDVMSEKEKERKLRYKPKKFAPKVKMFEYPGGNKEILYPLFTQLSNNNDVIHILHYGDSQLELDRITSVIRRKFQQTFGGKGIGLIPVNTPYAKYPTIRFKTSENFKQTIIQKFKTNNINHRRYGILTNFSNFTKIDGINHKNDIESWFEIKNVPRISNSFNKVTQCRLLYGYAKSKTDIVVNCNAKEVYKNSLASSDSLQQAIWNIPLNTDSLRIDFKGKFSPSFYGISLESGTGVYVDNIPARSSSGSIFTVNDNNLLKNTFKLLNAKLVIFQFGANMVKNMSNNYNYYERSITRQIISLRKINPEITIIIVGVSDMAKFVKGQYKTYESVEKIRDAQKKAALDNNCIFWDLYETMGGKESMPSWAFHKPAYASKRDFAHFTYSGSRLVGRFFNEAFFNAYEDYQKTMQKHLKERAEIENVKIIKL